MACSLGSRAPALARSSGPGPEGASLGAEGVCVDGFIWACVPVCRLIASGFQESSWYLERRGGGEVGAGSFDQRSFPGGSDIVALLVTSEHILLARIQSWGHKN